MFTWEPLYASWGNAIYRAKYIYDIQVVQAPSEVDRGDILGSQRLATIKWQWCQCNVQETHTERSFQKKPKRRTSYRRCTSSSSSSRWFTEDGNIIVVYQCFTGAFPDLPTQRQIKLPTSAVSSSRNSTILPLVSTLPACSGSCAYNNNTLCLATDFCSCWGWQDYMLRLHIWQWEGCLEM